MDKYLKRIGSLLPLKKQERTTISTPFWWA